MIGIFVITWIVLACITCPIIGSWISDKWYIYRNQIANTPIPATAVKRLRLTEKNLGKVASVQNSYFENFLSFLESLVGLENHNDNDLESGCNSQDTSQQHADFGLGILQTRTNAKGEIERVYEYPEKTVIHVYDCNNTPLNEQYIYKTGIKIEKHYNELGWFSTTKFPSGSFIEEELDYSTGLRKRVKYLNSGIKIETISNLVEDWTKKFTYGHNGLLITGPIAPSQLDKPLSEI